MNPEIVLAAHGISMQYPGTLALDRVDFPVYRGQVNVVIGENGAGKSTLLRILAGIEQPTAGHLEWQGEACVAMIHQELNLLPNLSVADNIYLAREQTRFGVIDRRAQEHQTRLLMERLEEPIDPETLVGDLPLGQQQIVEIAKAIAQDVRVLIMDEPTSALSAAEIDVLFRLIRDLKSRGVAIVYISHRLEELLTIGDRVTVLRDGRVVAVARADSASVPWLVEQMTGHTAAPASLREAAAEGAPLLEVSLDRGRISFTARAGEIIGFYGLMGAGRTELFETLMGLRPSGHAGVSLDGRSLDHPDIAERIRAGLVLVPEERQAAGIVPTLSVLENMTLASIRGFYLSPDAERRRAAGLVRELNIRTASLDQPITSLSGGNQQKVVLSRYLLTSPKALLLDDPTRGVDVGAREEIYAIIRRLAARGMTILFASSELAEILALSTRVLVMSQGRIAAEFTAAEATEHALVEASAPRRPPTNGGEPAHP
ncbi:MAG TPA: sugar ABC transporter ATP-binding protein [Bryobacteraceae bacterium]|nr:sugar ABC transporter ATP-binding protein [Bryobacteraceae bacterium]